MFPNAQHVSRRNTYHSPFGFLQPLPIPVAIWEDISLNFIVRLSAYNNQTIIVVIVDRFSKVAHFGTYLTS